MDNEKYGIELELITNKFKEKMQEVKSAFSSLTDKKVNIKPNQAQLDYLLYEMREISNLLDANVKKPFMNEREALKLEAHLEKLMNQYEGLKQKQNQVSTASTRANLNMTKGLDKVASKIRRFGLSLLSIRSIWALVSRASSAYLAQNTELSNRLQSVWAGLGALLSPIIEGIINTLAKAVKYIAIFIKALTGVDLLARATAKSMNGTTKAAKGLNKALAGFDELQNLDTDASGGTAGALGGIADLNDIKVDTKWADRLEKFGNYVRTNWPTVLSLLFGVVTFFNVVGPLMTAFGVKWGIIKGLGIGIAVAGLVYTISSLIKYLQDPSWENFGKIIEGIGITVIGLGIAFLGLPAIVFGVGLLIIGYVVKHWTQVTQTVQNAVDKINTAIKSISDWFNLNMDNIMKNWGYLGVGLVGIAVGFITSVLTVFKELVWGIYNIFDGMFKGIKQILDGIIKIFRGDFKGGLTSIAKGIGNVFISILNGVRLAFNTFITPFRALVAAAGKITGKGWNMNTISIPPIAYLDVGTGYVPEDQLAMLHKGESVIPKKFNSKEYFGGTNDETNSILERVIEAIENIEINPYTTIKDVGKASLSYINGKSRQLGESVVR